MSQIGQYDNVLFSLPKQRPVTYVFPHSTIWMVIMALWSTTSFTVIQTNLLYPTRRWGGAQMWDVFLPVGIQIFNVKNDDERARVQGICLQKFGGGSLGLIYHFVGTPSRYAYLIVLTIATILWALAWVHDEDFLPWSV
jgi:hypothetical protein